MEKRPDAGDALLSFGIASAVRDVAISVGVVLGLVYLSTLFGLDISGPGWHRHPPHGTPTPAGLKLQASAGLSAFSIGPWAGLGVLAACVAVVVLACGLLFRLRDA